MSSHPPHSSSAAATDQPRTTDPRTLLESLRWRYATKKFDPARKIPDDLWAVLEEAMVLSPSSFGLQPWKFLVIKDPALRASLREHSYNQPQITDASHLVVFARKADMTPQDVERYIQRIMHVRGVEMNPGLEGFRNTMLGSMANKTGVPGGSMETYTRSQVYLALGVLLTSAAMLGVDACPMEGFQPAKYDEVLGLAEIGLRSSVVAALGYRAADDPFASMKKVRFEKTVVIEYR